MKVTNWTVTFEKQDGSETCMSNVLSDKDAEYIDNEIGTIIADKGLWHEHINED